MLYALSVNKPQRGVELINLRPGPPNSGHAGSPRPSGERILKLRKWNSAARTDALSASRADALPVKAYQSLAKRRICGGSQRDL